MRQHILLLCAILLALNAPIWAQVEKVALRTSGISCGVCAVVSEINFKRTPGIDNVKISLANEAILLTYKSGASFSVADINAVLRPLGVAVRQFQISARGRVLEQGGKRVFLAGKDKFLLASGGNSSAVPLSTPVSIEGILNEHLDPMEVKVLNFTPSKH